MRLPRTRAGRRSHACWRAGRSERAAFGGGTMCDKKELKRQRENECKRRRYAEDPEFREKVLAVNRRRYAEDEEFRNGVKQRSCRDAKKNLEQRKQKLKSDLTLREQHRDRQLRVKYG